MKKANILRSIFWGLIMLTLLTLGIFGIIYNNNSFNEKKDDLERIVNIFNSNAIIKEYEKVNTDIKASLKGKKIIIECNAEINKTYIFNFKRSYLETNIEANDSIGKVILMILADSISVNKGGFEGDVYNIFKDSTVLNYKLNDGIEFIPKNDRQIVKINLEKPIAKPLSPIINDTNNNNLQEETPNIESNLDNTDSQNNSEN